MRTRSIAISWAVTLFTAVVPIPASADFLSVPGDYPTIQGAIDAAPEGAVIFVAAGVYNENIDFLGKALVVEGAGPDSVIHGGGNLPRSIAGATRDRFIPSTGSTGASRAIGAGDPSPDYSNVDGTRNTIGFTGGPYAQTF